MILCHEFFACVCDHPFFNVTWIQVSIRIENASNPTITYGRQFDHTQALYSKISRASIDACKDFFAEYVLWLSYLLIRCVYCSTMSVF